MDQKEFCIEIKGVERVFSTGQGKVKAIQGIDLAIRRGEFFSIVGPSGCGNAQPFQGQHCFAPIQRIDS